MNSDIDFEVGVIGAGAWGTTIASHLCKAGHRTLLWAFEPEIIGEINADHTNTKFLNGIKLPDTLIATGDPSRLENIKKIIVVVPSQFLGDIVALFESRISPEAMIVSATKGFISSDLMRPSELLEVHFTNNPIGVLSGPNLSREVARELPTISLVASSDDNLVSEFQKLLSSDYFRVYGGKDVTGTELGGALKNIIAIAAGMLDGLDLGENTLAALVTRGLSEMIKLGTKLGAETKTFFGVSGLGDLVCTSQSRLSRNHEVGRRLASGEKLDKILSSTASVAEGINTTRHVHEFAAMHDLVMPITAAVYGVLFNNINPGDVLIGLMTRSLKME
ncbi:MAG: NAD(P)-dependent glycerol-3-phosphate dehydrogenase [bacterium]|nr:NAD(P)-dependent glycerol-3-phosphate dehydrogenase [bacterium]